MNKIFSTIFLLMLNLLSFAQTETVAAGPKMADQFRTEGKIYVVIGVISIVFVCLVFFLVYLERKMKRLEEEMKNKN